MVADLRRDPDWCCVLRVCAPNDVAGYEYVIDWIGPAKSEYAAAVGESRRKRRAAASATEATTTADCWNMAELPDGLLDSDENGYGVARSGM